MNIQKTGLDKPTFKSGLTYKLIKDFRKINVTKAEIDFAKMNIDADFKNNKAICGNFIFSADILSEITGKYRLPFDITPPAIRVFNKKDLLHKEENAVGLCVLDTRKVLKKEDKPFLAGTILINEKDNGLFKNDISSSLDYLLGWRNSSHFLVNTLHEWFHCIQNHLILTEYGYEGKCPVLKKQFKKENPCGLKKLNKMNNFRKYDTDKALIKTVGRYAAESNSLLEMFAELMTTITTKSLDRNLNVIKNPMDNIPKECPKFVKDMVEETLNI